MFNYFSISLDNKMLNLNKLFEQIFIQFPDNLLYEFVIYEKCKNFIPIKRIRRSKKLDTYKTR